MLIMVYSGKTHTDLCNLAGVDKCKYEISYSVLNQGSCFRVDEDIKFEIQVPIWGPGVILVDWARFNSLTIMLQHKISCKRMFCGSLSKLGLSPIPYTLEDSATG
jgi:hypothetical protein